MDATTTPEPEINLGVPVKPIPIDLHKVIETDSTALESEANVDVVETSPVPEHAEVAANTAQEPPKKERRFFEPSQPLCGPPVRRETKDAIIPEAKVQEVTPQETVPEASLVPVTVVSDEDEMNRLHREVVGNLRTTLMAGMTLGEMLTKKKVALKRGKWIKWVKVNLAFDIRAAQIYMNLHKNREALMAKYETVAHLGIKGACRMLAKPSKKSESGSASEDSEVGDAMDGGTEIVETDTAGVTFKPENDLGADDGMDVPPVTKVIVAELNPEQSAKVLDFIIGLDIDSAVWDSLEAHGGMIRLTAMKQGKPSLSCNDEADTESPMEVTHE
jgi:hypothetical protein